MNKKNKLKNINEQKLSEVTPIIKSVVDEDTHLFVYGSVVIRDVESGTILIKKSF